MRKISVIVIGILIFLLCLYVIQEQARAIKKNKASIERLKDNIENLLQENSDLQVLNLEKDEVIGKVKKERDSLAKKLSVKPKYIEKIINHNIVIHDTIEKIVSVEKKNDTTFLVTDEDVCWKWEGIVKLKADNIEVSRLNFESRNTISNVYYFKRKFLFFGKRYYHEIIPKCGTVTTVEINFIRKK